MSHWDLWGQVLDFLDQWGDQMPWLKAPPTMALSHGVPTKSFDRLLLAAAATILTLDPKMGYKTSTWKSSSVTPI